MATLQQSTLGFQSDRVELHLERYATCAVCNDVNPIDARFTAAIAGIEALDDDDARDLAASTLESLLADWPVWQSARDNRRRWGLPAAVKTVRDPEFPGRGEDDD
jgi:hypothetical protein